MEIDGLVVTDLAYIPRRVNTKTSRKNKGSDSIYTPEHKNSGIVASSASGNVDEGEAEKLEDRFTDSVFKKYLGP